MSHYEQRVSSPTIVVLDSFRSKQAAIIYNPVARSLSRKPAALKRSVDVLARHGVEAELIATTGPGSAGFQARKQIEAGCDLIIAAGGDGTINEVAAGVQHTSVPLAILPGGTANVLARELHLPMGMERVAEQISKLRPVRIATGRLRLNNSQPRCFLCMAGAGLDAEIVNGVNLDLKAALGKFAYYIGGFSQVFKPLSQFEVTVDGRQYTASFALISRVRNYGGDLEIARGASLLRDDFEAVLFEGTMSVRYLQYLLGVAIGQIHRMPGCNVLRGRTVSCRQNGGEEIFVQVDGELAGKLPMTAEIVPDALTLLVPQDYLLREESLVAVEACA